MWRAEKSRNCEQFCDFFLLLVVFAGTVFMCTSRLWMPEWISLFSVSRLFVSYSPSLSLSALSCSVLFHKSWLNICCYPFFCKMFSFHFVTTM